MAEGADHLHIIDLDGAILGKELNASILSRIVKELDLFIQVGGGDPQTEGGCFSVLDQGVDRAILGPSQDSDTGLLPGRSPRPGKNYGGPGCKKGRRNHGRLAKDAGKEGCELGRLFEEGGRVHSLHRDRCGGVQKGIDLQPTRDLVQALKIPVVAAGGVTTVEDVLAL